MVAMDNQSGFMPLSQIGQGYASPPSWQGTYAKSGGPSMSLMQGTGNFGSRLQDWATQLMKNNPAGVGAPPNPPATGGGVGQAGGWMPNMAPMAGDAGQPATGTSLADNFGQPPNPPAANAMAGAPAGGAPSQTLANPPASGSPFGYGQPSPMMGRGFNAAGFGGLGATGGQGPGARYWSRLNNIGGA